MKKFDLKLFVIIIIIASLLEWMRNKFNIPVSILDLISTPISILMIYLLLEETLKEKRTNELKLNIKQKIFLLLTCAFLLIPLSIFGLYEGFTNPLSFLGSVKGSFHGYSLIPISLLLCFVSFLIIKNIIKSS